MSHVPPAIASMAPQDPHKPATGWSLVQMMLALAVTFALASAAVVRSVRTSALAMPSDELAIWGFLAAFAAATLLLILLTRRRRRTPMLEAIFLVAVFTGIGSVLLDIFSVPVAVIGTPVAVFLYYRSRTVLTFNLLLVMGCAGIASNLGQAISPAGAAVILAFLAVYDIVAVYVTKHMTEMAEMMLRRKVFFAMIVAERPHLLLFPMSAVTRGSGFTFLGTGDIILPALLVASVSRVDLRAAVMVAAGALIGLSVLHAAFLSRRERHAMPALPPIATGALVGYLAALL